ncbi:hypothetical protein LTR97_010969 [Elasticomyces elasticus]|uniref:Uncharacterized protein n=1 Tax=Elasticomyces elasticus TaxID=574655 RepID=A0AAN7W2G8_9PEZI|nr:hypothetical protein LTR97_010969 [Elasticomyces elasticus]
MKITNVGLATAGLLSTGFAQTESCNVPAYTVTITAAPIASQYKPADTTTTLVSTLTVTETETTTVYASSTSSVVGPIGTGSPPYPTSYGPWNSTFSAGPTGLPSGYAPPSGTVSVGPIAPLPTGYGPPNATISVVAPGTGAPYPITDLPTSSSSVADPASGSNTTTKCTTKITLTRSKSTSVGPVTGIPPPVGYPSASAPPPSANSTLVAPTMPATYPSPSGPVLPPPANSTVVAPTMPASYPQPSGPILPPVANSTVVDPTMPTSYPFPSGPAPPPSVNSTLVAPTMPAGYPTASLPIPPPSANSTLIAPTMPASYPTAGSSIVSAITPSAYVPVPSANSTVVGPVAPSVTLAPIYSSAMANLTSAIGSSDLTSIIPSASVDPIISSYIASLTSALPETAQPTGAVPTALPTQVVNGTAPPHPTKPHDGMSLKQILKWIAYLLSHAFEDQAGEGQAPRAHPRALAN